MMHYISAFLAVLFAVVLVYNVTAGNTLAALLNAITVVCYVIAAHLTNKRRFL